MIYGKWKLKKKCSENTHAVGVPFLDRRSQPDVQYGHLRHAYSIDSDTILLRINKNIGTAKLFHARQCYSRHNKLRTVCTSTSIWQMVDNHLVKSYQTLEPNLCDFKLWETITDRIECLLDRASL